MMSCLVLAAMLAWIAPNGLEPERRAAGVIVEVYELAGGLSAVPELPADQAPSAARVTETIDLGDGAAPFGGPEDNFVTRVLGFIEAPADAVYAFRLISDDGAKLWIGGALVVDHDGLHGAEPKDGEVRLTRGVHPLKIVHFEAGAGDRLALQWRSLTAAAVNAYELVPATALSHDPAAIRAAQPGVKRVIAPLRRGRPGDGSPIAGVHPALEASEVTLEEAAGAGGVDRRLDSRLLVLGDAESSATVEPGDVVVWLPPSGGSTTSVQASQIHDGVFAGQVLAGANPGGTIYRGFVDESDGVVQACLFQFSRGAPDPLGALAWDGDGGLLAGPARGDGAKLVRLTPKDATVFEMLAVRALANGFEIELTQPLLEGIGWEAESYYVERWPFEASATGVSAPARDGSNVPVKSATVSNDRRKVFVELGEVKPGAVYYLRLLPPCVSEAEALPWATEAWYTLHAVPSRSGESRPAPPSPPQNRLSEAEEAEGWRLLFDGRTTAGWHGFGQEQMPGGWQVIDGCLVRTGPGGDISTDEEFGNFELAIEWRICAAGNSGIFYRAAEGGEYRYPWQTGPEMQVLDNAEHADGRSKLTSAGSNYALYAPEVDATRPIGLFNAARIVVHGSHVEHWLNGRKLLEYELGSADWKQRVAASKFASMPGYGSASKGHIVLQDHGDKVWYRNIRIRTLP